MNLKHVRIFAVLLVLHASCGGPLKSSQLASDFSLGKNSPAAFPKCVLWLDANDPYGNCTLPSTILALELWVDKSGYENHAGQINPVDEPLIELNILNGKPGIHFNYTDNLRAVTAPSPKGWSWGPMAERSVYLVFRFNQPNATLVGNTFPLFISSGYGAGTNAEDLAFGNFQANSMGGYFGIDSGGSGQNVKFGYLPLPDFQNISFSYRNDIANLRAAQVTLNGLRQSVISSLYPNGYVPTLTNNGPNAFTLCDLGASLDQAYIFEVIVYDRYISDEEDHIIQTYLKNKWGI